MLKGAASILTVRDVAAAKVWYSGVLGFEVTFEFGTPLYNVCLCRDHVQLHLVDASESRNRAGESAVAVFPDDVDAVFEEISARGAVFRSAPMNSSYGMRDFIALDPDGNELTFGMAIGAGNS